MHRCGVVNLLVAISLVTGVSAIDCRHTPKRTDFKACCPHNDLISKKIADYCDAIHSPKRGSHMHLPNACYMECVVNMTGIMVGGHVDEAKLKTYLSGVFRKNNDILPIAYTAFVTCAQKLKEICEMMTVYPPNDLPMDDVDCKPCSGFLINCAKLETIFNCPADVWKDDEDCNNHREFYKTCNPPLSPHSH